MNRLQSKTAVITGGSSGIGLATAQLFAREGAQVFVIGRRKDALDKAVELIGHGAQAIQADISRLADIERAFQAIPENQKIDVVFANAGVADTVALSECSEEQFDKEFDNNVKGTLFTVQRAIPRMNDGGSIIMTGSVASQKGTPGLGLYGATKAAIRSFARTLANELSPRQIRANVISPGPIDTPLVAGLPEEAVNKMTATIPLGRLGRDEEVANVALFLASSESSYVTGIELFADGGRAQV